MTLGPGLPRVTTHALLVQDHDETECLADSARVRGDYRVPTPRRRNSRRKWRHVPRAAMPIWCQEPFASATATDATSVEVPPRVVDRKRVPAIDDAADALVGGAYGMSLSSACHQNSSLLLRRRCARCRWFRLGRLRGLSGRLRSLSGWLRSLSGRLDLR